MLPSVEMIPLSPENVFCTSSCTDDQVTMETFSKVYGTMAALDVESSWIEALANHNVTAIVNWIRADFAKSSAGVDGSLANFGAWIQEMADVNKKELMTLCFGCCRGLWMYLDQQSFTRIHLVLKRLRNLLSLARWGRSQVSSTHCWPVMEGEHWDWERPALEQHIWLGCLVQWWGTTGLLPKTPDCHGTKRISQMWREMDQNHRRAWQESPGEEKEGSSLIQGMVSTVNKQHGPVWTSGATPSQCYPPPSLQALLKLVLVPRIDTASVQAILMYFVLDVTNFLQCRDDLLKSFSHAFSIPPAFSQQIKGVWLLDRGLISQSMDLLLSPRSRHPWLSSQHRPIVEALLRRGEAQSALRYLCWNKPATGEMRDFKLHVDVFLQNRCVSEACSFLKRSKVWNDDIIGRFLCGCGKLDLCLHSTANMATMDKGLSDLRQTGSQSALSGQGGEALQQAEKFILKEPGQEITGPPRTLSARLYSSQGSLSSADVVTLLRQSVLELEKLHLPARNSWDVVWPKHVGKTPDRPALSSCHVHSSPPSVASSCERSLRSSDEENKPPPFMDSPAECNSHSPSVDNSESVPTFTTVFTTVVLPSVDDLSEDKGFWAPQIGPHALSCDRGFQGAHQETSRYCSEPCFEVLDCPDRILTLEDTAYPVTFNSLSKETAEDLICAVICEAEGATGFPLDITCTTDARGNRGRLNLHPQSYSNEDNQSTLSAPDSLKKSDNFLSSEYEKLGYTNLVPEEMYPDLKSEGLRSGVCSHQKSKKLFSQDPLPTSSFGSHSFLDLEPLQRASVTLEERAEIFYRGSQEAVEQPEILTACALRPNFSIDLLKHGDDGATTNKASPETGLSKSRASLLEVEKNLVERVKSKKPFSLQDPIHKLEQRELQVSRALSSTRSGPAHMPQPCHCGQSLEKVPGGRASPKKEAACFQSSSDRLGHYKLGGGWKQGLETPKTSTDLLPVINQIPSITLDTKGSHVSGRSKSHSAITFQGCPTKQKGDKHETKEVGKDEPVGRGSFEFLRHAEGYLGSQRGAFVRRGKRVKKV
ncbi:uncharacterized protein LOC135249771 isoform X3 [Anguilla rostrata]|uniref:uncharacterized protein LOC135249771 isoform X3 n=1 Tax=Anguilla rostrata TaxID=7938 RepID=UPI0030D2FBF0